jgi:hypothetical protein
VNGGNLWKDAVAQLAAGLSLEAQGLIGELTAEDTPRIAKLAEQAIRWGAAAQSGHPHAAGNLLDLEAQVAQLVSDRAVESSEHVQAAFLRVAKFGGTVLSGLITVAVNRLVGIQVFPLMDPPEGPV